MTSCDVGVAADAAGATLDATSAEPAEAIPPSSPMSKPALKFSGTLNRDRFN